MYQVIFSSGFIMIKCLQIFIYKFFIFIFCALKYGLKSHLKKCNSVSYKKLETNGDDIKCHGESFFLLHIHIYEHLTSHVLTFRTSLLLWSPWSLWAFCLWCRSFSLEPSELSPRTHIIRKLDAGAECVLTGFSTTRLNACFYFTVFIYR